MKYRINHKKQVVINWHAFRSFEITQSQKETEMTFILQDKNNICVIPSLTNSRHAKLREDQRGISQRQIMLAYKYGRIIHSRRASFHVIGKKEVEMYGSIDPELKEMNGIQLVVSSNGTLLTVYRNKDLRKIRPYKHSHKHLH